MERIKKYFLYILTQMCIVISGTIHGYCVGNFGKDRFYTNLRDYICIYGVALLAIAAAYIRLKREHK